MAPEHRKCLYSSLFSLTTAGGAFTASMLGGVLTGALGAEALASWGWRIPFLVGGLMGAVLLMLRHRLVETEVFRREVRPRTAPVPVRHILRDHGDAEAAVGPLPAADPRPGHRSAARPDHRAARRCRPRSPPRIWRSTARQVGSSRRLSRRSEPVALAGAHG
ncbi:hypothetical protein [Streptomyces boluensis]|uniref:hypothetical protein n=1 Tax=Streptomyces boluensis TaxID=1775135 RepID=UPI0028A748F7|nr:hypothetical protein [Streptomyces boluensis]